MNMFCKILQHKIKREMILLYEKLKFHPQYFVLSKIKWRQGHPWKKCSFAVVLQTYEIWSYHPDSHPHPYKNSFPRKKL